MNNIQHTDPLKQVLPTAFRLVPIIRGPNLKKWKSPTAPGWNSDYLANGYTSTIPAGMNAGICHKQSNTCAIDIDNLKAAIELFKTRGIDLEQMLADENNVQIVSGKDNRSKLLFMLPAIITMTETGYPRTIQQSDADGMVLEFRCVYGSGNTCQDVVPPSIHPETNQPYEWRGDPNNVPEIPAELMQWWQELIAVKKIPAPASWVSRIDTPDERKKIQRALKVLNPDMPEPEWRDIGLAIHDTGWSDSFSIWDEWSSQGMSYDPDAAYDKWQYMNPEGGINLNYLYSEAHKVNPAWNKLTPEEITEKFAELQPVQPAPLPDWLSDVSKSVGPQKAAEFILPNSHVSFTDSARRIFQTIASFKDMFVGPSKHIVKKSRCGEFVTEMKPVWFRSEIESYCHIVAHLVIENRVLIPVPKLLSKEQAETLLTTSIAHDMLPKIRAVSNCPVISDKGVILNKGYHDVNGGILITSGSEVPCVPLADAVAKLSNLLVDFKFTTEGDKSRAMAMMMTPALKACGLIPTITPMDIGEADKSQSGKTYRQKVNAAIYNAKPAIIAQRKGGVGSLDESMAQKFSEGHPFIILDNVRGALDSQVLEAAITSPEGVPCRIPNKGEAVVDISGISLSMTSNGVKITKDLANRSAVVRIKHQEKGFIFSQWDGGDLLEHVKKYQAYYLGCVFAVVREWLDKGRPNSQIVEHDMKAWATALDWIVQHIFKLSPLTEGYEEIKQAVSNPKIAWMRKICLKVKEEQKLNKPLKASDILELINEYEIQWPGKTPKDTFQESMAIGRNLKATFKREGVDFGVIQVDGFTINRNEVIETIQEGTQQQKDMASLTYTITE